MFEVFLLQSSLRGAQRRRNPVFLFISGSRRPFAGARDDAVGYDHLLRNNGCGMDFPDDQRD